MQIDSVNGLSQDLWQFIIWNKGDPVHWCIYGIWPLWVKSLRPRQNGRLFADDTFKHIFFNENIRISIKISLKFVPKGLINNIPALVLMMAWRRPGDKPLSEAMLVSLLTHICVTRPQWVKPNQSLYLLSGKTSYRQISWSLQAANSDVIMIVSLWNLTCVWVVLLPSCLSNLREIGGFEYSRDL